MKTSFIAAFLSCALLLTGCGSKQEEKEAEEKAASDSPADALQAIADKAKEMGDREAVDPVDFRKLKDLLPETLAGMSRTEATGEKTGAMGFTVSTAQAKYKGSSNESLNVRNRGHRRHRRRFDDGARSVVYRRNRQGNPTATKKPQRSKATRLLKNITTKASPVKLTYW
jgi:hypothetical protein